MNMVSILHSLAFSRPLFHSEADFQHALAWEIHGQIPEAQIRLEVPIIGMAGRNAVDVIFRPDAGIYGLELKYLKLNHEQDGERFDLASTGEANAIRYAICKDITRLEHMVRSGQINEGFLIVLTNDPTLWRENSNKKSIDQQFKVSDGRVLGGSLAWGERAGRWTDKHPPLLLVGNYSLKWDEYAHLDGKNGHLRSLVVPITVGGAGSIVALDSATGSKTISGMDGRSRLRQFFHDLAGQEVTLTFDEVEEYLGVLPPSASKYKAWWSHVPSHAHVVWELEGYVASPEIGARRVSFRKRRVP